MLYEKFYAGHSVIVRNQSDREAPWSRFHGIVDGLIGAIEVPTADWVVSRCGAPRRRIRKGTRQLYAARCTASGTPGANRRDLCQ